jgi:hypothetical protein
MRLKWDSTGDIKTLGFPPPPHDGYGFVETKVQSPNRIKNVLLGAKLRHFEVFFHEGPLG